MKKFNKYISLAAIAIIGTGLVTSCDDSKDNDFVQEYDGPAGIYFSNTANAYLELDSLKTTISYPVYRDVAGEELTVAITVSPMANYFPGNIYTFPESVTFPAGSRETSLTIGYDISKAAIGNEQQYEVTLDAESSPFASNSVILTLVNPIPWTLLGTNGKYYDYYWGVTADYSPGPVSVSVWQEGINKNHFRISNPYYELNEEENSYFDFYIMNQGDIYFGQTIEYNDLVGYDMYFVEYDPGNNADVYIAFPYMFQGFENQSTWSHNRVVQYQENGLPGLIAISPIYYFEGLGGNSQANQEPIQIIFPNFEALDISMSMTYEGIITPANQIQQVLISVDLGADITSARAAVAQGTDGNALISGIEDGSVSYTEFSDSGNVKINFGNENPTGYYTVAVVAYVGEDAKVTDSVTFLYISTNSNYDPNEGWTSLGLVEYTDAFVCSCPILFLPDPIQKYSVEIQQNNEKPGLYRLVNPYGAAYPYSDIEEDNPYLPYYLYVDVTDPNRVKILESPQDLNLYLQDEYGNVTLGAQMRGCWGLADYYEENGFTPEQIEKAGNYYGKYVNGKVTFAAAWTQTVQGETYLNSPLLADWFFPGEDEENNGLYTANVVMDYDTYNKTQGREVYLMTPTGQFYNPFMLDMSNVTKEANYRINGQVMLTKKGISLPGMRKLSTVKKFNNPNLKKNSKAMRQFNNNAILKEEVIKIK